MIKESKLERLIQERKRAIQKRIERKRLKKKLEKIPKQKRGRPRKVEQIQETKEQKFIIEPKSEIEAKPIIIIEPVKIPKKKAEVNWQQLQKFFKSKYANK